MDGFGLLLVAITGKAGAQHTHARTQGRVRTQARQKGALMGALFWLAAKLWQAAQLAPRCLACFYGPHNGTGWQWRGLVVVL